MSPEKGDVMLYKVLLFVHVLAVILWVGAGAMFQIISERLVKSGDVSRMKEFIKTGSLVPSAYFGVLTAAVLGSGIWMVIESGYTWEDSFVVGGIAGILASGAIGGAVIGRTSEALAAAADAQTLDEAGFRAGVAKLRTFGRLDLAIMAVVVYLMTVKPGT